MNRMKPQLALTAEAREADKLLTPAYRSRVAQQFFTHTAHAPVTILILEWLLSGTGYFSKPDAYFLILAAAAQAAWQAHPRANSGAGLFFGNLIGVTLYSLVESLIEGLRFFAEAQHAAYWIIAATFAVLQTARQRFGTARIGQALLLLENIGRAAIPVLLYAVFEARSKHEALDLTVFFADSAHDYLAIIVLLLGVLLGFADLTLQQSQRALRLLAERLHQLSSWGFGAHVVAAALQDAEQVSLKRQERSLLFMDIRGFTAWSERQAPEAVVAMLNAYYAASESVLQPLVPIKVKFTADEVMAVFAEKETAFAAAPQLQSAAAHILGGYGLSVGIGLHAGPVVEGLLGSASVKAYEVIGDAVNTASRLCSAAGAGELVVSEEASSVQMPDGFSRRQVAAKGKQTPLSVRVIGQSDAPAAG